VKKHLQCTINPRDTRLVCSRCSLNKLRCTWKKGDVRVAAARALSIQQQASDARNLASVMSFFMAALPTFDGITSNPGDDENDHLPGPSRRGAATEDEDEEADDERAEDDDDDDDDVARNADGLVDDEAEEDDEEDDDSEVDENDELDDDQSVKRGSESDDSSSSSGTSNGSAIDA
jgi:hypothetical protein